jgi:putative ABC transport system permease protein
VVSVLERKVIRDFHGHLGMLLAIISIIAVGVTCYVGLSTAYRNLEDAKQAFYADCRMADFSIELKKVPVAELGRLASLPGVAEIRPRIQSFVTVDLATVPEPLNGLVLSLPDRRQPIVNDIVLVHGGYFSDHRQNEVIVSDAFARAHGLQPGTWIRLLLNNRQEELFVVGTAISSEFVYLLGPGAITPDPKHFGVFYLKQSYAEDTLDFAGAANQVLGRLSPGRRGDVREVLRRAEDLLDAYGVFTTTPLEDQMSNRFLSQEIRGVRSFAVITPLMFLAVAALVLNVLLTRMTEQQRTVIGTLKALGYSDGRLFWHLLQLGLIVGVVGGLLGAILGYGLAELMTIVYRAFFQFPSFHNQFFWRVHLAAVTISIGCAVLGSLRGSRAVLRLRPAQAMRPPAPRQGGAIWLEHLPRFWNALSSGWRMVLRNLFRNRVRTAASTFAAAMGAALLVNISMMALSPYYLIDFQFQRVLRSDIDLTFKDERGEAALLEASRLPGVDRAEPLLDVACNFFHGPHRKKGSITGLSADARLTIPRDLRGEPIRIPKSGLAMSRKMADILHLEQGDLVTIQPIKGLRRVQQVPVNEIVEGYLGTMVYADLPYLSRLVGEESALNGVQLAIDQNRQHRRALYQELKQLPALQSTAAREDIIKGLEETVLKHQWIVIRVLDVFAGIVFFGAVINASLVSLAERRRELATLRVLGYGPWQVGNLLLRESLITTILGTFLGMPLGYLLTAWTAMEYESEMFRLPVVASAETWGRAIVLALVFALLAHLFVQRAIHKMDWLDALKTQE